MNKFWNTIFLLFTLFVFTYSNAQEYDFEKEFMSLDVEEKIIFYNKLNDSLKKTYTNYLLENIDEFKAKISSNRIIKKTKFIEAQLNYFKGNYIESINILNNLISQKKYPLKQQDSLEVYNELKKSYYRLYLYPEIFEINTKIKKLINKGVKYPLWTYNMNSVLYAKLNQFDKAANALQDELRKLKQNQEKDELIIPSAYNDLGYYYYEAKKYDSAYTNFKRSLFYAEKSLKANNIDAYKRLVVVVKGNIAGLYVIEKKYIQAIELLKEDISIGIKTKSNLQSTFYSYNLLLHCYSKLNDFPKAKLIFQEAERYIPLLANKKSVVKYYINKSEYFELIHKMDSANFYLKKAYKIKDSIATKGLNKILASNEMIYDITEKQRLEEKHLVALKNQELNLRNFQKNALIIFVLLLAFLLFLSLKIVFKLKKSRKEIKEKNDLILLKNQEINKALNEKEILLKEVHHRVKNNLQIISGLLELQNISIEDESVKIALKEGQNRIQSVALVHKMMYQSESVSKVNLDKYLNELIQILDTSYGKKDKKITTKINAKSIVLDITKAVPLSLIVNEAVCNVYKHAFVSKIAGNIIIDVNQLEENQYELIIKDNGVGLPDDFDLKKLKSIGLDLIRGLAKQLKGNLIVNSEKGTEIKVVFFNNN